MGRARLIALASAALFAVMPFDAGARCGPAKNREISRQIVALNARDRGVFGEPAFYLRLVNQDRPLVMFFKPEDVVDALQKLSHMGTWEPDLLLAEIQKELPIKTDTDLYKYFLRSIRLWPAQDWLVTELLRSGRAAIAEAGRAGNDSDPAHADRKSIVMFMQRQDEKFWFCTQDGIELHSETRIIED